MTSPGRSPPSSPRGARSALLTVAVLVHVATRNAGSTVGAFSVGQRTARPPLTLPSSTALFSSLKPPDRQRRPAGTTSTVDEADDDDADPDAPAGIVGAEFFGGSKQKEEFYDAVAEREAAKEVSVRAVSYDRFSVSPSRAFDSDVVAALARALQGRINDAAVAGGRGSGGSSSGDTVVGYSPQLKWESPLRTQDGAGAASNPLEALRSAGQFYKQVDVAVVAGRQLSDRVVELSWEVGVVWPTFWAPRVMLSGTSTCTLNAGLDGAGAPVSIVGQVDRVFGGANGNLLPLLGSQIVPRFWDWYHIGMTPSAERLNRQVVKKTGRYAVYRLPARLVAAPTIVETGTRTNRNAQIVPNHAFSCIIKTMGPQKQEYVPTTPVEVRIGRGPRRGGGDGVEKDDRLTISWAIPLSVQFQAANADLPIPGDNPEDEEGSDPTCTYDWQPPRQVATVQYGGNVQDEEISDIRKRLYEQILKDGWKPKLDEDGRPQFFFWQNDVKACYTEEGFGMCVYEWRPAFSRSNEVGIELDVQQEMARTVST